MVAKFKNKRVCYDILTTDIRLDCIAQSEFVEFVRAAMIVPDPWVVSNLLAANAVLSTRFPIQRRLGSVCTSSRSLVTSIVASVASPSNRSAP